MKEKINQLAKGIFEYETSEVVIVPQQIQIEVDSGESREGSFTVSNVRRRLMKGIVNTDCPYLTFEQNTFRGVEQEIAFHFHGERFMPGEVVKGNIRIVSDCGTKLVPFSVSVGVPSCDVSTGKIKDLFHFANLARESTDEAVLLFRNPHFEEVFLYRDNANIALYRGLSAGTSKGLAMEEFLIAIHKKLPIQLAVNQESFEYDHCTERFMDQLVITKDNWGFGEFHITSDADFIVPEHKIIWTDNFVGNQYPLSFLVDPEKMTPGKNYARITLFTVRQRIQVMITAEKSGVDHEEVCRKRQEQLRTYELIQAYLEFCMDHISTQSYLEKVETLVRSETKEEDSIALKLYRIHLGIMNHQEQVVEDGLAELEGTIRGLLGENPTVYASYYYLKGLWSGDDEVTEECVAKIRECYENVEHSWQIMWFLLYLDPEYQPDRRKLSEIIEQLKSGCHSPILYLEVCNILNEMPGFLKELTPELGEAIHWGCKKNYLEKELALRYVYLAGRQKHYSSRTFDDLVLLYLKYPEDEVLTAICKTLMKGQITSATAFSWYAKGIERNLKITDLYEYYMYSLDENQEIRLNRSILLYFLYDNHLTMDKKAMLYAYIVRNRENDSESYKAYEEVIRTFTFHQLKEGRISENLAVLYETFIHEESLDSNEELAVNLPEIMFCHKITCDNPDIVGVYVRHRELKGEEFVPLTKGEAVVTIFTEQAQIFLADALDNRYVLSINYTTSKLLHLDHLAQKCLEKNGSDIRLLLYLYDRADHLNQTGKHVMEIRRKVLGIPELSDYHRRKGFSALLRYYYDNFEGELLDAALEQMDWKEISVSDREQFIEYCAVRHCFDKAMEGIMLFGYEEISAKRLLQISEKTFQSKMEEDVQLVKLAWYMFQAGKYNEYSLRYLCHFFTGGIYEMVQIWQTIEGLEMEVQPFEERLLAQIVFTGEMAPEAYEVFYHYYEKSTNKKLVQAFIKMMAYQYLVKGWILPNKVFECFFREVQVQENLPCLIAVLKHFSQKKSLTEEEINFADYHVNQLYAKKIVFPFYRDFHGKFPLPVHIMDEQYVEYIADPGCEVKIHYLISSGHGEEEYITETMRDVFEGIRVKEFVLFQDELLQYYISEQRSEGEVITKSASVHMDESMDSARASSRYHTLNLMMIAQEMHDDTTLIDMMEEYAGEREMVKEIFHPM